MFLRNIHLYKGLRNIYNKESPHSYSGCGIAFKHETLIIMMSVIIIATNCSQLPLSVSIYDFWPLFPPEAKAATNVVTLPLRGMVLARYGLC